MLFFLLFFFVVLRADSLASFAFFGVVHAHLLGMLGLPILRIVRVLPLLEFWWPCWLSCLLCWFLVWLIVELLR